MKFYILPGPFRLGFGITSDHERREKDYTGAWGGIAEFKYLFEGPTPHVKRLENIIKTQSAAYSALRANSRIINRSSSHHKTRAS